MTQWITMDVRNFDTKTKQKAIDWLVEKYKLDDRYIDKRFISDDIGYYSFDNDDNYNRFLRTLTYDFEVPPSDIMVRMGCNNLGEM